jgi:predicted TPR repeat methyltransferase
LEAHAVFGDYSEILKSSQRVGRAREIADLIALLPEFGSLKKMLDLGGGPGLIALAVLQAASGDEGVIFETPDVGKICAGGHTGI